MLLLVVRSRVWPLAASHRLLLLPYLLLLLRTHILVVIVRSGLLPSGLLVKMSVVLLMAIKLVFRVEPLLTSEQVVIGLVA